MSRKQINGGLGPGVGWDREPTTKKAQGKFLEYGKILYLDYGSHFTDTYICQNPLNCPLKMVHFNIHKLDFNKIYLKIKKPKDK